MGLPEDFELSEETRKLLPGEGTPYISRFAEGGPTAFLRSPEGEECHSAARLIELAERLRAAAISQQEEAFPSDKSEKGLQIF